MSTAAAPAPGGSIAAPKLASVVAQRIEAEVMARGWPVGTVLGSETELLERYGVSRAVLREAVRIVEHTGAAGMRRGPGGGLVVTAPRRSAVVAAMGVWFSYLDATIDEMFEIRVPLMVSAVRLAAERRTDDDVARLHDVIEEVAQSPEIGPPELMRIESEIAAAAGNPALALFIDAVGELGVDRIASGRAQIDPSVDRREQRAHFEGYRPLAAAIAEMDAAAAERRMRRLLDVVRPRVREAPRPPRRGRPLSGRPNAGKLAEQVAVALRNDIERAGWPVGEVIGSENELIERYDVSRAVLREAVRILEHLGAVTTKRGPEGGVIVSAPDTSAIARSASLILEYQQVTADQLFEARAVLEAAAVRLAAERATAADEAELRAMLTAEAASGEAAPRFVELHLALAAVSGNRLFAPFVAVMGGLVPSSVPRPVRNTPELSAELHRAHAHLVDAVLAGDAELAERRMLRHLEASAEALDRLARAD